MKKQKKQGCFRKWLFGKAKPTKLLKDLLAVAFFFFIVATMADVIVSYTVYKYQPDFFRRGEANVVARELAEGKVNPLIYLSLAMHLIPFAATSLFYFYKKTENRIIGSFFIASLYYTIHLATGHLIGAASWLMVR